MRVSTEWLSDYISLEGVTAEELASRITSAGIEIDIIENRNQGVSKVVVGYVKSKEKHPDADKLNVCIVDAGQEEDLQIVCGAKNVDAGQKVPVALVGAKLPGGLDIKKAKLRGVLSQGMICSAKELGMNDKLLPKELQEGILVLPEDTEIGRPIVEVLGLNDQVLELDLTPNRSDCLSMVGAAYEVSAILGRELTLPQPEKNLEETGNPASDRIAVRIDAPEQCSHYAARYIAGVTIGPSPLWMQNRLMAAGIRPINNIVDITNYVMLEYGQPLHAFDADRLTDGAIHVRLAEAGEKMVTLDGQERRLEPHMLVIASGGKPAALAGVMGGLDSEVTDATVNIFLESAKFDGGTVRKTSRQLGLRSEASSRFEKEVDPAAVIPALNRAAELMAEYAGGAVHQGIVEAGDAKAEAKVLKLSLEKLNRYLGTQLSLLEVKTIFSRLHFPCGDADTGLLDVEVPTRRGDIQLDVDLIEEVARLYGYDNIPTTAIEGPTTPGALTKAQAVRRSLRKLLTHGGFQEVLGYSFIHPQQAEAFTGLNPAAKAVKLAMPMSEDRGVLRTSLLPQLLDVAVYNSNRKQPDLALFEIGNLFHTDEDVLTRQPEESPVLGLLLSGRKGTKQWNTQPEKVDFFDLKGALESILSYLGIDADQVSYEANQPKSFHPGRSASVYVGTGERKQLLGILGQIHPTIQQELDLEDTYAAEIRLEPLYELANSRVQYRELPRFPGMERDLAIVVDEAIEAAALIRVIREHAGELLQNVRVFDVFTGSKLGEGKKSVAISLTYRHQERTLTDEEVAAVTEKAVLALEQTFGAELRK
ncbi:MULTISPECIES: phenylalanine--tRNA ligase subunit beta [Paenibacillus]|uniref:Phenylalanine--tRNA ligase beta subunit n=1 Tax=Paenibacillus campinasensis TaxID=66347 RepID=A0A268EP55_9BACL|nr:MULTISPECIES: phenylalanine--tRNA ligase subunit beta [Paenibacillus]MUG66064.1 phenylalanine--tRNA ligase subunit beta [Paenibacillus campinasensis]PAD74903.1 phenylalanine--tRNA ligase subunit beta [Paenibacillus campinasensis]PAK50076.1 phenylalanine--tRNA ligase subunit beta [Paenibacillus sp. 7541]